MILMKIITHCRVVWKKIDNFKTSLCYWDRTEVINKSFLGSSASLSKLISTILAIKCGQSKKIKLSSSPPVPLRLTSMLLNFLWPHSIWSISQTTLILWEGKFLYFCQNIMTRIVVLALCRYYFACLIKTWLVESWSGFWTLLNTYEKDF